MPHFFKAVPEEEAPLAWMKLRFHPSLRNGIDPPEGMRLPYVAFAQIFAGDEEIGSLYLYTFEALRNFTDTVIMLTSLNRAVSILPEIQAPSLLPATRTPSLAPPFDCYN